MSAAAPAATPRCFGAAAMDPKHPCTTSTRSVVPKPKHVERDPGTPCGPTRREPERVCTFGTPQRQARRQIALVGDSHALSWRPALDIVARARRWRAYSVATAGCFFSAATAAMQIGLREPCGDWYRWAQGWFEGHPEISTVFVSQRTATPVLPPAGQTELDVKVDGFRRAWSRLPKTVRRIIVIRDPPAPTQDTFECVRRAIKAGRELPGTACRMLRSLAVSRDPAVAAVLERPSRRYRYVDLTSYFCTRLTCDPVIGGVLVYRDDDHITNSYSRTLGPFLLRKVSRILA